MRDLKEQPMTPETYIHNSLGTEFEAVQLTKDNLEEAARWCSGRILAAAPPVDGFASCLALDISSQGDRPMEVCAFPGDWIARDEDRWHVFMHGFDFIFLKKE